MAVLMFLALFLSLIGSSSATYCICKDGLPDSSLQKTIDFACGAGADCRPIIQNGACYQPNTVKAHCDYAANSYFQNKAQAPGTCDFSGTATPSTSPPSTVATGCTYPTSASQVPTTTTGGNPTGTPGAMTGGGTTTGVPGSTTTGVPGSTTTGVPGSTTTGIFSPTGFGPSGSMTDSNPNDGCPSLFPAKFFSVTFFLLGLLVLWS